MSRDFGGEDSNTRIAILKAARATLEEHGYHGAGLEAIARRAGVSRQAVYLHFGSKAGLLLSLVDWMDRSGPLPQLLARVFAAEDALEALDRMMEAHATYDPQILGVAIALDSARRTDSDAAQAWDDRMRRRHQGARFVAEWLEREGALADGMSVIEATDILWGLASIQVCEQLIVARKWSRKRYGRFLKRTARAAVTRAGHQA